MVPMAAPVQVTAAMQQQYDDARRLQEEENILRRAREIEAARQAPVLSNQRIQELKEQEFRRQRAQQVPTSLAPPPPVAPGGPAGHGEAARAPAAASAEQSAGQGNPAAEQAPAPPRPRDAQEEEEEEEDAWDEWQWWYQGHHQGGKPQGFLLGTRTTSMLAGSKMTATRIYGGSSTGTATGRGGSNQLLNGRIEILSSNSNFVEGLWVK